MLWVEHLWNWHLFSAARLDKYGRTSLMGPYGTDLYTEYPALAKIWKYKKNQWNLMLSYCKTWYGRDQVIGDCSKMKQGLIYSVEVKILLSNCTISWLRNNYAVYGTQDDPKATIFKTQYITVYNLKTYSTLRVTHTFYSLQWVFMVQWKPLKRITV